jgi:hypothetical protein
MALCIDSERLLLERLCQRPGSGGLVVNRIVGPNETITADRVKDGAQSIDPGQEAALH